MPSTADDSAVRDVLRDAFSRIRELVAGVCDGLTLEQAVHRPAPDANSIAWLVWHLSRIQDDHLCGITGQQQVWIADGWYERFDLPFEPDAHGYGHDSAQVAQVRVEGELLDGYHGAVHEQTLAYVDRLDAEDLARVVDDAWDPPVTGRVRLVSVISDCLQHVGQAAYVRGHLD